MCGTRPDALPGAAQIHHESKHPKIPWDVNSVINTHELSGGVTTAGVAVRGGLGKKK